MARKKKTTQKPTLAELVEQYSVPESGFAIKEGYEHIPPEELVLVEEPQDANT